jgi:hypothetical protein
MANLTDPATANSERDNAFFTSTIVGLPTEVVLGKAFTKRKLSQHPSIRIHATSAAVWHSEAARLLLSQRAKPQSKTLGLPYPAGNFAYQRYKYTSAWWFFLGFCLCGVLFLAYMTLPWVQQLLKS